MNLFFLDLAAKQSATYHCDKHVVKLILEATQMLYTVWHLCEPDESWKNKAPKSPYKLTHKNHPLSIWVRTNNKTYDIVSDYCHSLLSEYTFRYGKIHSSQLHMDFLTNNYPTNLPKTNDNPPIMPLCMPEQYKVLPTKDWNDVVTSYRAYYIGEKLHFCSYKKTSWPFWLPPKPIVEKKSIVEKVKKEPTVSKKKGSKKLIETTTTIKTKKVPKTKIEALSVSATLPPPNLPSLVPGLSHIRSRSQSRKDHLNN